jgi:hypothetical protein
MGVETVIGDELRIAMTHPPSSSIGRGVGVAVEEVAIRSEEKRVCVCATRALGAVLALDAGAILRCSVVNFIQTFACIRTRSCEWGLYNFVHPLPAQR